METETDRDGQRQTEIETETDRDGQTETDTDRLDRGREMETDRLRDRD